MKRDNTSSLGNIIRQVTDNYNLKNQYVQSVLEKHWEDIVGEYPAKVCKIDKYDSGSLYLKTHSSTWKTELMLRAEFIIDKIKVETSIKINEIKITVE